MHFSFTRITALAISVFFLLNNATAQQINRCATDEKVTQQLLQNPAAFQNYLRIFEKAQVIRAEREAGLRGGNEPRIIPVVFHVIHEGGSENISKAQLEDQIRILNEDFTRTNADTVNTRAVFLPVAANPNINFRLAQIDPDGNCTEGITRTFSSQTSNAGDNVKALIWWDNTKYLNIWVVRTIESDGTSGGVTLGFSSLPGFGGGATDGIVVRADCIGSIGNVNQQLAGTGRTLTHEIGHYLGLFHTFQGGCSGGFFGEQIDDTPPVAEASFGCDTTANSCTNDNPDLPDMIENYMDYANDECMNIFTLGQSDVMNATLDDIRDVLYSPTNLAATGTDGSPAVPCAPVADFYAENTMVCEGDVVNFTDNSYNGTVDTRAWSFPTGNPTTSASASPNIQFSTPGFHNVSLTVTNTQGNDSKTINSYIYVSPENATISNWQYFEGFEGDNSNNEWLIFNEGNVTTTWQQVSNAAYSGSKCMKISNFTGNTAGAVDNLVLPSIDFTQINTPPTLRFKLANAQRPGTQFSSASEDRLKVMVSTNCGKTWQTRYNKAGADLATAGTSNSAFTPSSQSQWEEVSVNLSSFAAQDNVLIKFEATSDGGNNLYIDDINLTGPVGVEEVISENDFSVYPNPSDNTVFVNFTLNNDDNVELTLNDVTGKTVTTITNSKLNKGPHSLVINKNELNASGIYFLNLKTTNSIIVRKILFF
jgi:PKD repeat protein